MSDIENYFDSDSESNDINSISLSNDTDSDESLDSNNSVKSLNISEFTEVTNVFINKDESGRIIDISKNESHFLKLLIDCGKGHEKSIHTFRNLRCVQIIFNMSKLSWINSKENMDHFKIINNLYINYVIAMTHFSSKDHTKIVIGEKMFEELIDQKFTPAIIGLGELELLIDMKSTEAVAKAINLFNLAIEYGDSYGYYSLAKCYLDGTGVNIDKQQALILFEKANPYCKNAQVQLIYMYKNGIGTKKDPIKAMKICLNTNENSHFMEILESTKLSKDNINDFEQLINNPDIDKIFKQTPQIILNFRTLIVHYKNVARKEVSKTIYVGKLNIPPEIAREIVKNI
jgi:hypothetical protein